MMQISTRTQPRMELALSEREEWPRRSLEHFNALMSDAIRSTGHWVVCSSITAWSTVSTLSSPLFLIRRRKPDTTLKLYVPIDSCSPPRCAVIYNYWEIKSMRQRLDLDALLRKYETNYSPRAQPTSTAFASPRAQPKIRVKLKTETDLFENDLRYFNSTANRAQP